MSLKAKIEAVIYASEEPVTLAQLAGLLGHEAQAELDSFESAQQPLALDAEQLPSNAPEPEPTEAAPAQEPEQTEESPAPEHPPETPDKKQAERARERKLRDYFRTILKELIADYTTSERGLEVREVADGYRLGTKPEYHDAVRGFVKSLKPPLKLSLQALETLAVIAYKQPVTAPEISEIRGVDSSGVLGSLMARKLITTAGRKQVIGRPILYKTTRDFLLRFGLKDVSELPSIEEFEKMAVELAETFAEPVQEDIPMQHEAPESAIELEEEKDTVDTQLDGDSIPLDGSDESSAGVPGETVADEVLTDGRISGLPPQYDRSLDEVPSEEAPFDSPAMDAELQREQADEEAAEAKEFK